MLPKVIKILLTSIYKMFSIVKVFKKRVEISKSKKETEAKIKFNEFSSFVRLFLRKSQFHIERKKNFQFKSEISRK